MSVKGFSRRDFLRASALGVGAVAVSTGLAGCLSSSDNKQEDVDRRTAVFTHGIASGDPLQDAVMLWTRVVPESDPGKALSTDWEVATDPGFTELTHTGSMLARQEHDFTVKVDVRNLLPGQTYYYRFRAGGKTSVSGITRTLPEGAVEQVKLAVVSCSNYPAGYFHFYTEVAKEEGLDAVVHLGDYIYEYGAGEYATEDAAALGRTFADDNDTELLTLTDYRKRYALYRNDAELQKLHAAAPFIMVWDDHEVANDAWREGAANHNPELGEGDFADRKLDVLQAYFEWLPIRPVNDNDEETIYRSFQFGDLVDLHMLDTRLIGRDEPLDYKDYLTADGLNESAFGAAMRNPNRTMLGAEQFGWVVNKIARSEATWTVLGQQVLMGQMTVPGELLASIVNPDPAVLLPLFEELATLKGRQALGDPSLTAEDIARLAAVLPYNLDAWDGYPVERESLLQTVRQLNRNLVVLAGDTHNAWANDLKTIAGDQVGVEFATASVSSPGLEDYLSLPPAYIGATEDALTLLVDDLNYVNVSERGYMVVTFTPEEAQADWRFVSTIKNADYELQASSNTSWKVLPGGGNRRLVPVGS